MRSKISRWTRQPVDSRRLRLWRWIRRRDVTLILIAVIAVAAVARLLWLDLMEFKADEAAACRLALRVLGRHEPGTGSWFPTAGLSSSLGIAFPPLFVYVLALPLAIVRDPVAAAAFVAITNVVAVWLCYVAGTRYFSRFIGLASAALFALSPWAIVHSRKIWSPDLLPICTCSFLIALHEFLVRKRPRAAVWLILLVGLAVQFHFSAALLVVVVAAAFVIGRDTLRWRYVAFGLAGIAVLYAPYIWHVIVLGYETAPGTHPSMPRRFLESTQDTLVVGFEDGLGHVFGSQSVFAFPLSIAFGTISFAALLWSSREWRTQSAARARLLLALWFILPLVALTILPITPFEHYFVVLYPLPFLGLALALEALGRRHRQLGWLALAGCLAAFVFSDARLFRTVVAKGGAPGEYGIAYKYKKRAVVSFARDNPTRRFELENDPGEYHFLEWNLRDADAKPLLPSVTRYVLSTSFRRKRQNLGRNKKQFGPLQVTIVPLRQGVR
jgi:4-amino-4-deoxy-L-arabinose transferase-like glycosyltransferase